MQRCGRDYVRLWKSAPRWEVVVEACDGAEAVAGAIDKRPDVAIIDYSMPLMTGLEATRRIKQHPLPTEILILTMHD